MTNTMTMTANVTRSKLSECDLLAIAKPIREKLMALNDKLNQAGVALNVRNHYVNTATGLHGIKNLIREILTSYNAIFPIQVALGFRELAIAKGMFASDIIACERLIFGYNRYPDSTIRTYLSSVAHEAEKMFGAIQLTAIEDSNRTSPRPRCKFFLIAD